MSQTRKGIDTRVGREPTTHASRGHAADTGIGAVAGGLPAPLRRVRRLEQLLVRSARLPGQPLAP
jgi:hypothetical protein